ncbi:hypothetical protein ABW19_dt0209935 [Dactylella cylindrospora]|nr:hypothetical protein ABW19_dt0209935 [Dactylella cylindrospora]
MASAPNPNASSSRGQDSKAPTDLTPRQNQPHYESDIFYGHNVQVQLDPSGGVPTVIRERPYHISWERMSESTRNMFADLAMTNDRNRFQACVEATLTKWAVSLKPDSPNLLPDGNPAYLQDDTFPVIKAYVNRVPRPGISGSPIPPALPMIDLEALDFLHHHQVLPYQQEDYKDIFDDLPNGFIWHPIQTIAGIRGIDHRTLYEFRAYKHFWAIHKDDKAIREVPTKDDPTFEVSIIAPTEDVDSPKLVAAGFHNLMMPPGLRKLREALKSNNEQRKEEGIGLNQPVMYVRFADNVAKIVSDHVNDLNVFDKHGIPRLHEIAHVKYDELLDTDEFLLKFTDLTKATISPLLDLAGNCSCGHHNQHPGASSSQTQCSTPTTPKPNASQQSTKRSAEVEAKIQINQGEVSITTAKGPKNPAKDQPQPVRIPEAESISKQSTSESSPSLSKAKGQLGLAEFTAIESKIKQLSLELDNPRYLPSIKTQPTQYASAPIPPPTTKVDTTPATAKLESKPPSGKSDGKKDATKSTASQTAMKLTMQAAAGLPPKPDPRLKLNLPGAFFGNHLNRLFLVQHLESQEDPTSIPKTGPGARSWTHAKEDRLTVSVSV